MVRGPLLACSVGVIFLACGGSSSETPYPLEPDPDQPTPRAESEERSSEGPEAIDEEPEQEAPPVSE